MAAETGFTIDGELYELPSIDTFTMDEAQVLYDYCGLTLEDFVEQQDETPEESEARERRFKNPGLLRSLMHIAYQRKHQKQNPSRVKALIGQANIITALEHLNEDVEEDAVPLASTTEPKPSSERSSAGRSESSGSGSTDASDAPGSVPASTGTSRSDTSSPASPLPTLVS